MMTYFIDLLPFCAASTALRSAVLAAPVFSPACGASSAEIRATSVTGTAASGP